MTEPGMHSGGPHVTAETALGHGSHRYSASRLMTAPTANGQAQHQYAEEGHRQMSRKTGEFGKRIVPATENDWPWIIQGQIEIAWKRLGAERRKGLNRQDVAQSVERQVNRLRQDEGFPSQAFVACTDDGRRAGFVWVARGHNVTTGRPEASLLNQYVAEAHRGEGLGMRLMETAENWARDQGLLHISLSVGVHNTLGQRLYKGLGYEVETLRMSKQLTGEPSEDLRLDIY
jgi:ribosomal protein S18 acetylase RimI-like enzyme